MSFDHDFALLTGNGPFPWQRALYARFVAGDFPTACDLPTGLGKTSVIALWVLALAANSKLPRRLVYVVNRRTVVDQSTTEAERVREALGKPEARHLREALDALAAAPAERPLAISTLRGEFADNGEWRRDPARPSIIIGTVDMIGSRLLFSGYGCGFRSKPLHAGFLGQDALLVHDEAHLEPAFQSLLTSIADEQRRCDEPRPLKVLALSATGRTEPDFSLGAEDLDHPTVKKRLHAKKGLELHDDVAERKDLPECIAKKALELEGKVVVFLSSVEHVEKCAQALRKAAKDRVATLTGTMRGAERDALVKDPVFARFLPRPSAEVKLQEGRVFLVATSAGEVGIDLSADHMVTDLPPFDALAQRLGRVNRYGEGDADVHVFCEELEAPPAADEDGGEDEDEGSAGKGKDEYDYARYRARALLGELPQREDGRRDASPWALRGLPREARLLASTPQPDIHHVDGLLFDRWSYTTFAGSLPGRPPVAEWLHGKAEWEAPRTTVAWRREVAWLKKEHLGRDTLDDFLDDYPLRSRETLSDVTSRVVKHLQKLADRDKEGELAAWLIRHDRPAEFCKLADLLSRHDSNRGPILDEATVVLAPEAGGLSRGLLDGSVEFDPADDCYDQGPDRPKDPDQKEPLGRVVHESEEQLDAPDGMRLVRSIKRKIEDEDDPHWWHLYAMSQRADDDGSRTSTKELTLTDHLQWTGHWADRLAEHLALPEPVRQALTEAGHAHDLGKRRRVWQRSIKRFKDPPLAKGPMQPLELGHYRHELGSLHDGDFAKLGSEERDLALHVVAAHHGRARPHFPIIESFDPEVRDELVAALVREVPLRFERLQQRYGRWGLAWLESILRAADVLGSEQEEVAQ